MRPLDISIAKTPRLRLAPRDREDIEAVARDPFQSVRARKRAKALLLIEDNTEPVAVHMRTGIVLRAQEDMLSRLALHGVPGAIFGSPLRPEQRQYDVAAIKKVLSECLASRPPEGSVYWNLALLTEEVHKRVEGAETITRQSIGTVLRKELGIRSIRHVEPYWLKRVTARKGSAKAPKR